MFLAAPRVRERNIAASWCMAKIRSVSIEENVWSLHLMNYQTYIDAEQISNNAIDEKHVFAFYAKNEINIFPIQASTTTTTLHGKYFSSVMHTHDTSISSEPRMFNPMSL